VQPYDVLKLRPYAAWLNLETVPLLTWDSLMDFLTPETASDLLLESAKPSQVRVILADIKREAQRRRPSA
jgi:hypothetical protein